VTTNDPSSVSRGNRGNPGNQTTMRVLGDDKYMGNSWVIDNKDKAEFFKNFIDDQLNQGVTMVYTLSVGSRTQRQNNALHLWFRQIATLFNDSGQELTHPLVPTMDIPWTENIVKEVLYKLVIKKMYDKGSTTGLSAKQLSEAAETLSRWLAQECGIYAPFPQTLKDSLKSAEEVV